MSWQTIVGFDACRRAFAHAVRRGRLAHAYLLTGPVGIGKELFATELARALLCENPGDDLLACDRCVSCTLTAAGNHPDLFAAGRPADKNELPIEVIRELCRRFSLKPARGRAKIGLLDDADDLNEEAANCFLKTLEEPPPRSVLFLIGTSPQRQLATIVSRCQVVRLPPLSDEAVAGILGQQGVADGALLPRLVRLGRGSPGLALALADPDLWKARKELLDGFLQPRPNSVEMARTLMSFVEEAGKEGAAQRRRSSQILRLLVEFANDALAVRLGRDPRLGDAEELAMLRKMAERMDEEKLLRFLERCLQADAQIGSYIQLVLVLEALLDALAMAA